MRIYWAGAAFWLDADLELRKVEPAERSPAGRILAAATARVNEMLTRREVEVLRLLAAGLSNNKIGEKLYISATTAKFHVSNIMRKLEVSRRAEAVYAASKRGLI